MNDFKPSLRRIATIIIVSLGLHAGQALASAVAFVQSQQGGVDLEKVVTITRNNAPLEVEGRFFDLEPGDKIYLLNANSSVLIRYLGNNAVVRVRRRPGAAPGRPDYVVQALKLPSLPQVVFDWLVSQFSAVDTQGATEITAASRTVCGSRCPTTARHGAAEPQFSSISNGVALLSSQHRSLRIAWTGAQSPGSVQLVGGDNSEIVAERNLTNPSSETRLDGLDLKPGRYVLSLNNTAGVLITSSTLIVTKSRPPMPKELANAKIDETARAIYYASWLSAIDGGLWKLEALQLILNMDCTNQAVQEWQQNAGFVADCDSGKSSMPSIEE